MHIVHEEVLIQTGLFHQTKECQLTLDEIRNGVSHVVWPPGSNSFTIYPESGKKRGEGNGVLPIKDGIMDFLKGQGWQLEHPTPVLKGLRPGKIDAVRRLSSGIFALEWETGNISSSHRSLNKMALGIMRGTLAGGALVLPSTKLAPFLTDRIGNYRELEPYFDLWRALPCADGLLTILVVEHDSESTSVPRIPKGTDGRASN